MPTILIVDDEESVRSILCELLSLEGYDCTMASNVKEARAQLENHAFEIVLSDFNMPGESGLELLEHVFSAYPGTVGMMLTGMNDPGIEQRAVEMGVSAYMTKPFRFTELLGAMQIASQGGGKWARGDRAHDSTIAAPM